MKIMILVFLYEFYMNMSGHSGDYIKMIISLIF